MHVAGADVMAAKACHVELCWHRCCNAQPAKPTCKGQADAPAIGVDMLRANVDGLRHNNAQGQYHLQPPRQ